jgi:putative SOS response-associated peptidase YedK
MVERYTLTSLDDVAAVFGAAPPDGATPRFNIAPLQLAPIRSASSLAVARWGLLPPWRGHGGKRGPHVLHAPIEDLEQVPLLRNAFKSQRCLVIADGFFVWRRTGKKPQPVWVHPAPDPGHPGARSRTIAFAGIAATHRDDDQLSFAVLVGPASALVAPHAAAMPVVIPAADYATWLTGSRERARELLATPLDGWRADPVSTWVNSAEHDDARCVEPLGNPAQGELF